MQEGKKKTNIITRKLKFYPVGDNKDDFYSWFDNDAKYQTQAKQLAYTYQQQKRFDIEKIVARDEAFTESDAKNVRAVEKAYTKLTNYKKKDNPEQEKIDELEAILADKKKKKADFRAKRTKEAWEEAAAASGFVARTELAKLVKSSKDELGELIVDKVFYKEHFNSGITIGEQDMNNDYAEIKYGKRSSRVYKTTDILSIRVGNKREFDPATLKLENGKYFANLTSQFTICFDYGHKASVAGQMVATLKDIINGNYEKLCDSKIQKKDGKFFLLLTMEQAKQDYDLDENLIMGIDLGIDIPAFIAMAHKPEWKMQYGAKRELLNFKTHISELKRLEKKRASFAKGGHGKGRKTRDSRTERIRKREANFAKNYNHTLSRQIVNYAIKNRIGKIRMEDLTKDGFQDTKMLGVWTYYQLQEDIQYKAEQAGIIVEKVKPNYTSATCSHCGFVKDDFSIGNRDGKDKRHFLCPQCGLFLNCDHNAAINIAKGGVLDGKGKQINKWVEDWKDNEPIYVHEDFYGKWGINPETYMKKGYRRKKKTAKSSKK